MRRLAVSLQDRRANAAAPQYRHRHLIVLAPLEVGHPASIDARVRVQRGPDDFQPALVEDAQVGRGVLQLLDLQHVQVFLTALHQQQVAGPHHLAGRGVLDQFAAREDRQQLEIQAQSLAACASNVRQDLDCLGSGLQLDEVRAGSVRVHAGRCEVTHG